MTNAERYCLKEDRLKVCINKEHSRYVLDVFYEPKHCKGELIPLFHKSNIKKCDVDKTYYKWYLSEVN